MKDRSLKALSIFNFLCMVMVLLGAGIIVVKAETIAQYLANGVYVKAGAITPTSGAVAVADGTSFVQSTTPTFNGVNVTVDGVTTIKNYVDSVAVGVESKDARLATIAVLSGTPSYLNGVAGVGATLISTAFGALSVDGTTVAVLDRILVKNQADPKQNGIYTVTATGGGAAFYTLTRALDNNDSSEMTSFLTSITAGGTLNGTQWLNTSAQPVTVGSTNITFAQFTANIGSGAVTGTLPYGNGGTGATAFTQHNVVTAGASALTSIAPGTSGNVLTSDGTDWASSAAPSGGNGIFGNGADGTVSFDGTNTFAAFATTTGAAPNLVYTLIRDIYSSSLTISNGITVNTACFRVFCSGTATISGTLANNGNAAVGATPGAVGNTGTVGNGSAGGGASANGSSSSNSAGAVGGTGNGGSTTGGVFAVPTAALGGIQNLQAVPSSVYAAEVVYVGAKILGGSGGGGGVSGGGTSGAGGGGGGALVLIAKSLAGSGALSAKGGAASAGVGGNASGGGGGGGGFIVVTSNSASLGTITTDVTGGALGGHAGTGLDGTAGGNGNTFFVKN